MSYTLTLLHSRHPLKLLLSHPRLEFRFLLPFNSKSGPGSGARSKGTQSISVSWTMGALAQAR